MNDISTDHGCNDADRRKLKYLETDLSHCCLIDHNICMEWHGIRPGPLRCEAGNYLCHGTATAGAVHASKIRLYCHHIILLMPEIFRMICTLEILFETVFAIVFIEQSAVEKLWSV